MPTGSVGHFQTLENRALGLLYPGEILLEHPVLKRPPSERLGSHDATTSAGLPLRNASS